MRTILLATLAAVATPAAAEVDAPSAATLAHNRAAQADAPFADTRDMDFAARGFVATRKDPRIVRADGGTVWDLTATDILKGKPPATVNPSLWRHSALLARHGLFKVTDRIWQVRGFDLANITFVKGDTGWIVIDALSTTETAKAALDLVTERLGARPIAALIVTHSHSDHFGGSAALVSAADAKAGKVAVIAPAGFLKAAISENVIAGPAMQRRAVYQFGVGLPFGATGTVGSGIGPALAVGTQSLVAPNREIARDGETLTIDGVRLAFQLTPGTEAPAEMNIAFPDWKVVDMAENANVTQHNILTPRGAQVRDAKAWAEGLTRALERFGDSETMIASHGWPRFGRAEIADYLAKHRDAYAFLHDQTVRLMNQGLTGPEIATRLVLPPALQREWYDRPYYGSLSFNARAVYQYYLGWYDGNPVHLAARAPADAGARYVAAIGGAAKVIALATDAYAKGDYAWAAELLDHLVLSDRTATEARSLLARCYDQLAWQSENSLWRNMYRTGAEELRAGGAIGTRRALSGGLAAALPTTDLFDLLSVRIDPAKAGDQRLALLFVFPESGERILVRVANGVMTHTRAMPAGEIDATLTVKRTDLVAALVGGVPLAPKILSGEAKIEGAPDRFQRLVAMLDAPGAPFPIVLPR